MFSTKRLLNDRNYCVIQDFETKTYHYYPNAIEMLTHYLSIPEVNRAYNEVIFEGPQKMRLDIDSDTSIDKQTWKRFLKRCYNLLKEVTDNGSIAIFEMSDDTKYSCHMICVDRAYESSRACKALCLNIRDKIGDHANCIDTSVYSRSQHFRLEGSRKPNTLRYKYLSYYDTSEWNMTCGLIGYVTGLSVIKNWGEMPPSSHKFEILEGPVFIISDWCKVRGVDGNCIQLTRTLPSYCQICCRTHESENPFLIIKDGNGLLYCRRSFNSEPFTLPIVNDTITL